MIKVIKEYFFSFKNIRGKFIMVCGIGKIYIFLKIMESLDFKIMFFLALSIVLFF